MTPQPPQPNRLPASTVVAELQAAILRSVLGGAVLSNGTTLDLPDLGRIVQETPILVATENLAGPVLIDLPTHRVEVHPTSVIHEKARTRKSDVAYLSFRTPRIGPGEIEFLLEGRIASMTDNPMDLGLSGLQVRFEERDGTWQIAEPPFYSAA